MMINLENINRRHMLKYDAVYRINYGLCSKLVNYRNGMLFLQVMFDKRWTKDYEQTTEEIANCWKENHPELINVIGAKVYIIDAREFPYKKGLYLVSGVTSYDAKKGILFNGPILN
ncbi:MAG: hypothetical protein M3P22_01985 [bacterium]|nr:hypothetical protein [bacterium]